MDKDVVMHQMTERFQELYAKALESLDQASEGRWIAESEWAFRDVFQQLMRESYQAALQGKIDAQPCEHAGLFPPPDRAAGPTRVTGTSTGPPLADHASGRNKGRTAVR